MTHDNNNGSQNKFLKNLKDKANSSLILRFIFFLADILYKNIGGSMSAFIFTGYEKCQSYYEKSFLYGIFQGDKENRLKKFVKKFRKAVILRCERSIIINRTMQIADVILTAYTRNIGVMILSFGFYSTIVYLLKLLILNQIEMTGIGIFTGPAIVLASIPLLFCKQRLYDALKKSVFVGTLIFKFIGFPEKSFSYDGDENHRHEDGKKKTIICYSIGMIVGLATYFISPLVVCVLTVAVIFMYLLLCKPEMGVMAIFVGLPFLPTMVLAGFGILIAICYFIKLVRGKRVFTFELFDLIVLIFCGITMSSGVISVSATGSIRPAMMYTCFTLIYFVVVNMIRSHEMIIKSVSCLIFSGFVTASYGIYQNYAGVSNTTWQDSDMFSGIAGRVVSTFENPNVLAEYLILVIPFCIISLLFAEKSKERIIHLAYLGSALLCLVYTWSRGSWLGFLFSSFILFIVLNKKAVSVYVGIFFTVPLMPLVLPSNIVHRFTSIGNLGDSSTSYRVSIWTAVFEMIKNFALSGIGMGTEAFRMVYPEYSLAGIESAPHSHSLYLQICVESGLLGLLVLILIIFFFLQYCFTGIIKSGERHLKLFIAAGMCAVAGFLLNGFTDYVWYNYRVYFMFWLVIALTVAICRFSLKNQIANENI